MYIGLGIILIMVFILPFTIKKVEQNLEFFLFAMGLAAVIISSELSQQLIAEVITNKLLYFITLAVLLAGLLFKTTQNKINIFIEKVLGKIPIKLFVFLVIIIVGVISSVITSIIAALLLAEIVNVMPLKRKDKINVVILSCFSIGFGAALTPIGEPLSTIVVSKLNSNFWYLAQALGAYIFLGIVLVGMLGALITKKGNDLVSPNFNEYDKTHSDDHYFLDEDVEQETYKEVTFRSLKVFIFIIALELLGAGFKPIIEHYIIGLDSQILYFLNMVSAVLDNATIAAAEVSIKMTPVQIKAVLLGLLISGGMLIPGNIPNIISAHKLKITSKEWAKLGLPVGLSFLILYFLLIFVF